MIIAVLLIVLSPYTALIPSVYTTYKVLSGGIPIYKNLWNIGLITLFVWSMLVGILNKSFASTMVALVFLLYFSMSIYIQSVCNSENLIEKICRYLIKFSCFAAVLGIVEKIVFTFYDIEIWRKILGIAYDMENHRVYSTFGNPNVTGNWFAIMILIAMYLANITSSKKSRRLYKLSTILFVCELFLTGSRGAYVALLVGLVILFLFKSNKNNNKFFASIFLLVVLIAVIPSQISFVPTGAQAVKPQVTENVASHDIDRSVSTREEIWIGCGKMIKERPITGWGFMGTLEQGKRFINYEGKVYHAHNIWLSFFTASGIVGLLIYLAMKIYLFKNLFYLYKERNNLFSLMFAIQVLIITHGVIDFTMIAPQSGMLFIACSSMIIALVEGEKEKVANKYKIDTMEVNMDIINK